MNYENISVFFVRVCLEASVKLYHTSKPFEGAADSQFIAIDSFARLLVLIIKYHSIPGQSDSITRISVTDKILSVFVLVLVHTHEENQKHFNQKPFFRLFSAILNELKEYQCELKESYLQILASMRLF
jgi:CCR4-NOT transcription complex subunit 1